MNNIRLSIIIFVIFSMICITQNLGITNLNLITKPVMAQPNTFIPKIVATGYVTWWSYDSAGYHPTIMVRILNASPVSLSWVPIKFQARFTDTKTGQVTVDHQTYCNDFNRNQVGYIKFKGPGAFDLSGDTVSWPRLNCKVMCRVGEVGDVGTQTIVKVDVQSTILTDDQATNNLSQMPDIRMFNQQFIYNSSTLNTGDTSEESDSNQDGMSAQPMNIKTYDKLESFKKALDTFFGFLDVPGLGQGYYLFQQKFGKPLHSEFLGTWTWVEYEYKPLQLEIYVGAKDHKGKANLIVVRIPGFLAMHAPEAIKFVKMFTGVFSKEELSPPIQHVKYTHSGRVDSVTSFASGYNVVIFQAKDQNDSTIITMGNIAADWEKSLQNSTIGSSLLSFLFPYLEESSGL